MRTSSAVNYVFNIHISQFIAMQNCCFCMFTHLNDIRTHSERPFKVEDGGLSELIFLLNLINCSSQTGTLLHP